MKRTPIKRTAWRPKRKALRGRSERREAISEERRALVARLLSERQGCEAMAHLRLVVNGLPDADQRIVVDAMRGCTLNATEVHEVLSRARGGSILDEENCLILCHTCHAWVTTHPRLATMAGLLQSRWQK